MSREEDTADITAYDLAQRIVDGQFVSAAGIVDVAKELLILRASWERVGQVLEDNGCECAAHPDEVDPDEQCLGHAIERAWTNR